VRPLGNTETSKEILSRLSTNDLAVVNASLELVRDLTSSEENRSEALNTRETNLLAFAGIIGALTVEITGLITSVGAKNHCVSIVLAALYVVMLVALLATVWLTFDSRRRRLSARPHINGVFEYEKGNEIEFKKMWLADLISAYKITTNATNTRVDSIYRAQEWLTAATVLLLVISALAAIVLALA
jgi:hypothetical protein